MSARVEFANVGTPRKRNTFALWIAEALAPAGAAGMGPATDVARTPARITLPNCFTVGTSELPYPTTQLFFWGLSFTPGFRLGQHLFESIPARASGTRYYYYSTLHSPGQ